MPKRKSRSHQAVTILDVAKHAGVSPMTASRVINGNPHVGEAMRERVQTAAKALSYKPNLAGRLLRTSGVARIGVLYSNPSAAYLNELMIGVLEESSEASSQVIVEKCTGIRSQRAAMQRLLEAAVDGVILPPPLCDSLRAIGELSDQNVSVVAVASGRPAEAVASVRIDDYKGACAMVQHLLKLGHRRIGLIKGDPKHTPAELRTQAFFDTMQAAGIAVPKTHVVDGRFTYRSGLAGASQLLNLPDRPTAIFCSNDDMAAGAMAVAHGMDLRIPDDITITGFDDTPVAATIWPKLTTVRQPVAAMGRAAVRMIIEQIQRQRQGLQRSHKHEVMKYTLVKRESAAPPAARDQPE